MAVTLVWPLPKAFQTACSVLLWEYIAISSFTECSAGPLKIGSLNIQLVFLSNSSTKLNKLGVPELQIDHLGTQGVVSFKDGNLTLSESLLSFMAICGDWCWNCLYAPRWPTVHDVTDCNRALTSQKYTCDFSHNPCNMEPLYCVQNIDCEMWHYFLYNAVLCCVCC